MLVFLAFYKMPFESFSSGVELFSVMMGIGAVLGPALTWWLLIQVRCPVSSHAIDNLLPLCSCPRLLMGFTRWHWPGR